MQVRKEALVVLTSMYNLSCSKSRHTTIQRSSGKVPLSRVTMVSEEQKPLLRGQVLQGHALIVAHSPLQLQQRRKLLALRNRWLVPLTTSAVPWRQN